MGPQNRCVYVRVEPEFQVPSHAHAGLKMLGKVLANASSYGIYAEMNRQETEERVKVQCHGIDPEPYQCSVIHPENPGEFCFPPLAALITRAARLMLALLEHCVSELKGTYAMEDTDSMAIVAMEHGGIVPFSIFATCAGLSPLTALCFAGSTSISGGVAAKSALAYGTEKLPVAFKSSAISICRMGFIFRSTPKTPSATVLVLSISAASWQIPFSKSRFYLMLATSTRNTFAIRSSASPFRIAFRIIACS